METIANTQCQNTSMQVTDTWQCASSIVEAEQDKCGIDVKSVVIRDSDSQITMKKEKEKHQGQGCSPNSK